MRAIDVAALSIPTRWPTRLITRQGSRSPPNQVVDHRPAAKSSSSRAVNRVAGSSRRQSVQKEMSAIFEPLNTRRSCASNHDRTHQWPHHRAHQWSHHGRSTLFAPSPGVAAPCASVVVGIGRSESHFAEHYPDSVVPERSSVPPAPTEAGQFGHEPCGSAAAHGGSDQLIGGRDQLHR
jgi:hypothetical protein